MTDVRTISTQADLDKLASSNRYVLVDFWADWAGPSRTMKPIFDDLAKKHGIEGRLAFAKVDVDEAEDVRKQFNIEALPTFMALVHGKPVEYIGDPSHGVRAMVQGMEPVKLQEMLNSLEELAKEEDEREGS